MTLLSPAVDETVTATTHIGVQDLPVRPSARDPVAASAEPRTYAQRRAIAPMG